MISFFRHRGKYVRTWRTLIGATVLVLCVGVSSLFAAVKLIDLQVYPRTQIAPVSSEVILVGGVVGSDNHYETNARIDWTIQEGSVGEFIDVEKSSWASLLIGDRTKPERVSPTYARTSTLRKGLVLNRGTTETTDDVTVESGQSWVSLTSAVEGTTYISAYAPAVSVWPRRRQDIQIHWVDCQWQLPAPRIAPAGTTEELTTYVKRSDGSPCVGWLVEYKITGGPAATFQPGGEVVTTLRTDTDGKATVTIGQTVAAPGPNTIQVQVTRPEIPGSRLSSRLVIGSAPTTVRWTASALNLQRTGPQNVTANTAFRYVIQVSNSGDAPAKNVVVKEILPDGVTIQGSKPTAKFSGQEYTWELGSVAAGSIQTIEVGAIVAKAGTYQTSVEVQGETGNISQSKQTLIVTDTGVYQTPDTSTNTPGQTTPSTPSTTPSTTPDTATQGAGNLVVEVDAPPSVKVGDIIPVKIRVKNTGTGTVDAYIVKNIFSNDLMQCLDRSTSSNFVYSNPLPALAPKQTSDPLELNFKAVRAGSAKQTISASWETPDVLEVSTSVTTQITEATVTQRPIGEPTSENPTTVPADADADDTSSTADGDTSDTLPTAKTSTVETFAEKSHSVDANAVGINDGTQNTMVETDSAQTDSAQNAVVQVVAMNHPVAVGRPATWMVRVKNPNTVPLVGVVLRATLANDAWEPLVERCRPAPPVVEAPMAKPEPSVDSDEQMTADAIGSASAVDSTNTSEEKSESSASEEESERMSELALEWQKRQHGGGHTTLRFAPTYLDPNGEAVYYVTAKATHVGDTRPLFCVESADSDASDSNASETSDSVDASQTSKNSKIVPQYFVSPTTIID